MRRRVFIKQISIKDHLFSEKLVSEANKSAVVLDIRVRACELVVVEEGRATYAVGIGCSRARTVRAEGGMREEDARDLVYLPPPLLRPPPPRLIKTHLQVLRGRVRAQKWRHGRVTAIFGKDRIAMIKIHHASDGSIAIAHPKDQRRAVFAGILIQRIAVFDRGFAPL